jgi:hypothetical protein
MFEINLERDFFNILSARLGVDLDKAKDFA